MASGFRSVTGVLLIPLHDEFGWSHETIGLAVSLNLLCFGLGAPFAAALVERAGCATRHQRIARDDRGVGTADHSDDRDVAAVPALGPRQRARHRRRLGSARRDHREPLVRGQTRPRHRPDDGELCVGAAGLPAGARLARRLRLALGGVGDRSRRAAARPAGGAPVHARPAGGRRAGPVRGGRELAAAAVDRRTRVRRGARRALAGDAHEGVLAPRRDVLRLRCDDERARLDASDPGGARSRHHTGDRSRAAGADRRLRRRRDDSVGVADRPVRPAHPPARLLRTARRVAARAAAGLRLGQCGHARLRRRLRARLGRDGAADLGAGHGAFRFAGGHRLRLGLRRTPARCGDRGVGRRAGSAPRPATTPRPSWRPACSRSSRRPPSS